MADKAYDADFIRLALAEPDMEAVIPPKKNRKQKLPYDKQLYKERHCVENFFGRIKRYRKIATRYAQLADMYFQAVCLIAVIDWLR